MFKQKSAYGMRISDGSSDVCSSDLGPRSGTAHRPTSHAQTCHWPKHDSGGSFAALGRRRGLVLCRRRCCFGLLRRGAAVVSLGRRGFVRTLVAALFASQVFLAAGLERSEEHTSELQSLMRISYAVFCLK